MLGLGSNTNTVKIDKVKVCWPLQDFSSLLSSSVDNLERSSANKVVSERISPTSLEDTKRAYDKCTAFSRLVLLHDEVGGPQGGQRLHCPHVTQVEAAWVQTTKIRHRLLSHGRLRSKHAIARKVIIDHGRWSRKPQPAGDLSGIKTIWQDHITPNLLSIRTFAKKSFRSFTGIGKNQVNRVMIQLDFAGC